MAWESRISNPLELQYLMHWPEADHLIDFLDLLLVQWVRGRKVRPEGSGSRSERSSRREVQMLSRARRRPGA
jgi:hypothetical protein